MRRLSTFAAMLRWLSAGIFASVLVLALTVPSLAADTGTYRITNYIVTLEPQSDGQVKITYEQSWQVLSGDIPWITVGLANSNYIIGSSRGAVKKVSSDNSGGFYGVRVDLDKDYQPGQSFNIKFSVTQSNVLERLTADKKWRINFTPGWYDRAQIDGLQINLISPVDYQTYTTVSPAPTSTINNIISWNSPNLAPGARVNIAVESLDGNFLSASVPTNSSTGVSWFIIILIVAIILVIGLLIIYALHKSRQARDAEVKRRVAAVEAEMAQDKGKKEEVEAGFEEYVEKKKLEPDAQGRYYDRSYGSYITPAIWAAQISSLNNRFQDNTTPSQVHSCACACVSCACACACACAGGGAAGCSRKSLHECRLCNIQDKSSQEQAVGLIAKL